MTVLNSTVATRAPNAHGLAGTMKAYYGEIVCLAAPTTVNTLNFFRVPAGFRVVGALLESDDLDTNASPTITLNIGDAGNASRFFAASNVAQAGTAASSTAVTGLLHRYEVDTLITGAVANNATTGAAGTIRLTLFGFLEEFATS